MKKLIGFIIAVIIAVGLYIPCRGFAVEERGNEAYGGEVLVPLLVMLGYVWWEDYEREKEQESLRQAKPDTSL